MFGLTKKPVLQRPVIHKLRVLAILKERDRRGVVNYILAEQRYGGFRFGEYIRQLRREGWIIDTKRITQGTYIYVLRNPRRRI